MIRVTNKAYKIDNVGRGKGEKGVDGKGEIAVG